MENIHQGHREKMRQRFLKSGLEGFADHEALELLLYYAIPRQDTNPIAHRLMDRYGSLTAVLSAPAEDAPPSLSRLQANSLPFRSRHNS